MPRDFSKEDKTKWKCGEHEGEDMNTPEDAAWRKRMWEISPALQAIAKKRAELKAQSASVKQAFIDHENKKKSSK